MEEPLNQLGNLIRLRRKELKIKQEDLAETTQVALRTIRDLEKGIGNPSVHTIQKLMEILGIELIFRLRK
ncbi:MAG: helix-turn-helix domain-containing protein [Bacteroidetes bacterium]|nr:helix-turn-helix domain-containing protein [Bacteroidota bacterium]